MEEKGGFFFSKMLWYGGPIGGGPFLKSFKTQGFSLGVLLISGEVIAIFFAIALPNN